MNIVDFPDRGERNQFADFLRSQAASIDAGEIGDLRSITLILETEDRILPTAINGEDDNIRMIGILETVKHMLAARASD